MNDWAENAIGFLQSLRRPGDGLCRSSLHGPPTLYGTCYAMFAQDYLGRRAEVDERMSVELADCQDRETGLLVGPEFAGFETPPNAMHTREFLELHSTCAALPFFIDFGVPIRSPIHAAHPFCDLDYLDEWTQTVDWRRAWYEGNHVMFIGQLLVYLRDGERHPNAAAALNRWFRWLDETVDGSTGLWGTNGYCDATEAVYGGYHQLLIYYYENHPLPNIRGMVDTVLSLQHHDGGFNPHGNAGACEDVDSVDILVNSYKRLDYRRADIRLALRRCLKHILSTQNDDGGFPYSRNVPQSHMGIPGTQAGPNESCTFPTWFRIHTLALIAEVLPAEPALRDTRFRFSKTLSMGWHRSPSGWALPAPNAVADARAALRHLQSTAVKAPSRIYRHCRQVAGRAARSVGLRT